MKKDYSRLSEEKLEKRIKELKLEMMKSQTFTGVGKVGKDKVGRKGSDILKRLRREIARILTELNRRRNENNN